MAAALGTNASAVSPAAITTAERRSIFMLSPHKFTLDNVHVRDPNPAKNPRNRETTEPPEDGPTNSRIRI
ncbi:hypothetical protein GCM10010201_32850 [Pilimelia columellifera subsp. columellifera]|uniref:Uncharacterized protein n=1 Tax=Pilimelia columellifera subsp. columellifera TaxID=706583 RepID=A0ABP6B3D8_9ACTN